MTRSKACVTSIIYPEFFAHRELPASLSFPNSSPRVIEFRHLFQEQVEFFFRVSLISDERQEKVVSFIVDSVGEKVDSPLETRKAVYCRLPRWGKRPTGKGDGLAIDYRYQRLFTVACRRLEQQVKEQVESFFATANQRKEREIARINQYYDQLRQEAYAPVQKVIRKLAVAMVRHDLTHRAETREQYATRAQKLQTELKAAKEKYRCQLTKLEEEKQWRLGEIESTYRVRTEAELLAVRRLLVPRCEFTIRLVGRKDWQATFLFDVLRQYQLGLFCADCEGEPLEIYISPGGDTYCLACWEKRGQGSSARKKKK